jgi:dTDP-L-rhamnose 4-epimerase
MRVLVTGGEGFIGSHIVDVLVEAGHDVVSFDCLLHHGHGRAPSFRNPAAEYLDVDLRDENAVEENWRDFNAVCHEAAMVGLGRSFDDVVDYVDHNDRATAVLLRILARTGFAGTLVLASSMVVYGDGAWECPHDGPVRPGPRKIEDLEEGRFDPVCVRCSASLVPLPTSEREPLEPRSVYAATKVHQEHLCFCFARETDARVVALRYHNVYGNRMPTDSPYAGVASIFRSRMELGLPPLIFEDGRQLRDFIHVTDVAHANHAAIQSDGPSGPFNIATGERRSIGEMAAALSEAYEDSPMPRVTGDYRRADVRHIFASPDRARREMGWEAKVPFAVGMEDVAGASREGVGVRSLPG